MKFFSCPNDPNNVKNALNICLKSSENVCKLWNWVTESPTNQSPRHDIGKCAHLPNSKTYQQPKSASNTFYFFFIADKVFDDMSIIHQARARKKERVDLKNVQVCLCVCVCERWMFQTSLWHHNISNFLSSLNFLHQDDISHWADNGKVSEMWNV